MNILTGLLNKIASPVYAATSIPSPTILIQPGFEIPTLTAILTFLVRAFFTVAALIALLFLLLGAFAWITSGGDKDAVKKAQDKIQSAIVGLILIVAVLAIMMTLEVIVFKKTICVGLTCEVSIPGLLNPCPNGKKLNPWWDSVKNKAIPIVTDQDYCLRSVNVSRDECRHCVP